MRNVFFAIGLTSIAFSIDAQATFADCANALVICEKRDIYVKKLPDAGNEKYEIGYSTCSKRLEETHSVWIKWEIGTPGNLSFVIHPFQEKDDIDFVLYRLNGEFENCSDRTEVRCMATGINQGKYLEENYTCRALTGLSEAASDRSEGDGCGDDHDNFLGNLYAKPKEKYLLVINNYDSDGGFKLTFDGTADFTIPDMIASSEPYEVALGANVFSSLRENEGNNTFSFHLTETSTIYNSSSNFYHTVVGCIQGELNQSNLNEVQKTFSPEVSIFPNPFNQSTNLRMRSPTPIFGYIKIFDVFGRLVLERKILFNEGVEDIFLDLTAASTGTHALNLQAGKFSITKYIVKIGN